MNNCLEMEKQNHHSEESNRRQYRKENEYYDRTKRHTHYDKHYMNTPILPVFSRVVIDDAQHASTGANSGPAISHSIRMSDLYKMTDIYKPTKFVTKSAEILSATNDIEFIQDFDFLFQRKLSGQDSVHKRFQNDGNITSKLREKQQTTGRTSKIFILEDNPMAVSARKDKERSNGKEKYRSFPNNNYFSNQHMDTLNNGKYVSSESRKGLMHGFSTQNANVLPLDVLQNESHYHGLQNVPLKLFQRPARAKRMNLHKPELFVIPEIEGTFVHLENLDSARQDMLLSMQSSSRSFITSNKEMSGREDRKYKRNNTDLEYKRMLPDLATETNYYNSFSPFKNRNRFSQPHIGDMGIDRIPEMSLHSFLPWSTSDDFKKWSKHHSLDNQLPSYKKERKQRKGK